MRLRCLVLASAVVMGSGVAMQAQMSGPPPAPAVGTKVEPAKALQGLLYMTEFEVVGAAKAMPADKYGFAPSKGIFAAGQKAEFDTVRTFAAQVTHLAQANYFFFSWSGITPDRDVKAIETITSKEEAVAALEASLRMRIKRWQRSPMRMRSLRSSRLMDSARG